MPAHLVKTRLDLLEDDVTYSSFEHAHHTLRRQLLERGYAVQTESWQGVPAPPMIELFNVTVHVPLGSHTNLGHWQADIRPNLPWADDHFEERVSGQPLNPPPSWAWWPYAGSAANFRAEDEKFNHTYPERYWPKWAGMKHVPGSPLARTGIRGSYGDLNDVVDLLVKEPLTRQAYLPVWFPEDTGIGDGGRKPCTLGYHFMQRFGGLHVVYPIRSCDFVRHFLDDCYLTVRLLLWVLEQCQTRSAAWRLVHPGTYTMHITSLHCFESDRTFLERQQDHDLNDVLHKAL